MEPYHFIPLKYTECSPEESVRKSEIFYRHMKTRRSVRHFSDRSVPEEVMKNLILTAASAPSGANKQPWVFCLVGDAGKKRSIREAAEKEERESYDHRMSTEWLEDLKPLGTDWEKPFLEIAPWLVVIFRKPIEVLKDGTRKNNYYVQESVGIAAGIFIAAVHQAGLVTLTHTPSPMNFLNQILDRPDNEKPFLLLPVGYPADNAVVPDIQKKTLDEVMIYF